MEIITHLACRAGVFWTRESTFLYYATILDSVTVEDWGKEIFTEGVGVKWKKGGRGRGRKNTVFLAVSVCCCKGNVLFS